jgi:hypothetical protein
MKKLIIVFAALCIASPAWAAFDFSNSNFNAPYTTDSWTLALYHFDEEQGDTIFLDSSGNGYHGYVPADGAQTWGWGSDPYFNAVVQPHPDRTWQPGKFGNAATGWYTDQSDSNAGRLQVDTTGDTLFNSLVLAEGDDINGVNRDRRSFTIEWWMKAENAGNSWGERILKKYTGGDYGISFYEDNTLLFQYWGVGGWRNFRDTFAVPVGEWHHVAFCVNRHQVPFQSQYGWIHNGVQTFEGSTFFTVDGSVNTRELSFFADGSWSAAHYPPRQFSGQLDEVRISNVDRYGVPEPTTMSLLAIGLAGLLFRKKK